jgi:glyoxylase-like metal-dependent hydrolase (beta-lactamase superfamily II)
MSNKPYHFKVGDFECIAVCDVDDVESVVGLYTNVSDDVLENATRALGYDVDAVPMSCTSLVIKARDQWVLVDPGREQGDDDDHGHFLRDLRAEAISPEDIDLIVITHGHGDHVAGLTDDSGDLNYPNAHYFMWKTEWEHWMSDEALAAVDEARAAARRAMFLPLKDKLTLLETETEIAPGIRLVPMSGHTPGQCGVLVESSGERLLNIADSVHTPMQLQHPEWYTAYDVEPDKAVAVRRKWFERAANERLLMMVYHLPFPSLGYVVQDGETWKWQPVEE